MELVYPLIGQISQFTLSPNYASHYQSSLRQPTPITCASFLTNMLQFNFAHGTNCLWTSTIRYRPPVAPFGTYQQPTTLSKDYRKTTTCTNQWQAVTANNPTVHRLSNIITVTMSRSCSCHLQ